MNPKLVAGSYDSSLGTWTDGGVGYTVRYDGGDKAYISGTIPYEDADAVLGLDAGNRLSLKLSNASIADRDALPSGDICTVIGDTTNQKYTKSAFETDGSLIFVGNVKKGPVVIKIKWTADVESVYTIDIKGAALEQAE